MDHCWLLLIAVFIYGGIAAPTSGDIKEGVDVDVVFVEEDVVRVQWPAVDGATQYSVRLLPHQGPSTPAFLVECQAETCEATFAELSTGNYDAKVTSINGVSPQEASISYPTTGTATFSVASNTRDCRTPFTEIGGRCYLVDASATGTWYEMAVYCNEMGGRLAIIEGENVFYSLIRYIHEHSLQDHAYWLGATDEETEGDFRWLDGSKVKLGTPFWSYQNGKQRPYVNTNANCLHLSKSNFLYFIDEPCTYTYKAICEQTD